MLLPRRGGSVLTHGLSFFFTAVHTAMPQNALGWKYLKAYEEKEQYKEGACACRPSERRYGVSVAVL